MRTNPLQKSSPPSAPRFSRLLLVLILLCAAPTMAWGPTGHRIVGDIAQRELSPAARAQVADLLRGESEPTLAGVANWADALRQSDPPRFKQTQRWHYADFPRGDCHYVPPRDCPYGNCVIGAIAAQRQILADPLQAKQSRIDALKFLVHFVGDIHQPFHAGYVDDRGGNGYQISLRTSVQPEAYARDKYVDGVQGSNLHAVWDYYILANHDTDAARYAKELATRPHLGAGIEPTIPNPADWVLESCRIVSMNALYPSGHKLDAAYLEKMRPLAEQRLMQAGHQLAQVLNVALVAPRPQH